MRFSLYTCSGDVNTFKHKCHLNAHSLLYESRFYFTEVYLFESFPLVLDREFFVCNQAFQQLLQGRLCTYYLLLLTLHPVDLFKKSWGRAEICI